MANKRRKGTNLMKTATKLHEYAARYLYDTIQMDIKTISKEIGLSVKQTEKILNITDKKPAPIPTATSSAENRDPDLLINKTQSNRGGVSIMTAAASTKADEINKQLSTVVSRTARNAIFRPKK